MSAVAMGSGRSSSCDPGWGDCPHCRAELQVHQPDPDDPSRLLAVCEDCHYWYLRDDRGALTLLLRGEE